MLIEKTMQKKYSGVHETDFCLFKLSKNVYAIIFTSISPSFAEFLDHLLQMSKLNVFQ